MFAFMNLVWHVVPICDDLLTGLPPEERAHAPLSPNTVELIPTLGALLPRGGPVPALVLSHVPPQGYFAHTKLCARLGSP